MVVFPSRTRSRPPDARSGTTTYAISPAFQDMNLPIAKDQSYLLTRYRAADAARVPLSVVSDQNSWLRHKLKVRRFFLFVPTTRVFLDVCFFSGGWCRNMKVDSLFLLVSLVGHLVLSFSFE